MIRTLRRIFIHNLGLKLVALAISFGLWATYTAEPFAEVGYTVPIAYLNVPQDFSVGGNAPNTVRVMLRGRSGLLRRLNASDLALDIDLAKAPSDTDIHIVTSMVRIPYGTEVVRVTPAEFHVALVHTSEPSSSPE